MERWDAIIVGARCAGASTAMLLARGGLEVLLLEKGAPGNDTLSTLFIQPTGASLLRRWGLYEAVRETGATPIRKLIWDFGEIVLEGFPVGTDVDETLAPRRTVLDPILVEAAVGAGATVRHEWTVDELLREGDRVVGVVARDRSGHRREERAELVVGADGKHSTVARLAGASVYAEHEPLTYQQYGFFENVPVAGLEVSTRGGVGIAALPTNDGLTLISIAWPVELAASVRSAREASFTAALELAAPTLAARVREGARAERFLGTAELPTFLRVPSGPGWALVGDAGYHKDPVTAQGISDALCDADLLADSVLNGTPYHERRDARALPLRDWTCRVAQLKELAPRTAELLRAASRTREHSDRFLSLNCGTTTSKEFFAPESVAAIMASCS